MWFPRARDGRNGEMLFKGYRVSVLQNDKLLEVGGPTIMGIYLTRLNCTLRNG